MQTIQNHPADRLQAGIDRNRPLIVVGLLAAVAALAVAVGLFSGGGQANPLSAPTPGQTPLGSAIEGQTTADQAAPGQAGPGSDGTASSDSGPAGSGSGGEPGGSAPSGPSGDEGSSTPPPPKPDPTPINRAPAISDVEVETAGLTVVVRYRVEDPDGDDVTTDVVFGKPVRTGVDTRPQAPQQGELSGETGGSGGGRGPLTVPTAPGGQVFEDTGSASDPATDEDADHGPRPIDDGRIEARFTYDRGQVGAGARATITIFAQDGDGAEDRREVRVDLEVVDTVTISDIRFSFPNPACFEHRAARRLHGNLDLLGAIESKTALDEELRADRPEVTVVAGHTVEATPGLGLTVSFQPAIQFLELTNHVVTHTESAKVDATIGSGDCTGRLRYEVVVSSR